MTISARSIPIGTKITSWAEPVLGQTGIMALSPRIASIFARWSVLEKQLNQLFILLTDADTSARSQFDQLRGWDRRVDAIAREADSRLDLITSDLVKVVLRLIKVPASKRDELAHRVWAVAEGFETELALLPPDDQHSLAEAIIAAKRAERCDIPIDNNSIYIGSSLVSAADLDRLILELQSAQERMDGIIRGHFFPPFADLTGGGFADYRQRLMDDPEISSRLAAIERSRKRVERAARRKQSAATPTN